MENPYETAARNLKAAKLAVVLARCGSTDLDAMALSEAGWNAAEAAAKVRTASHDTRMLVVTLLR